MVRCVGCGAVSSNAGYTKSGRCICTGKRWRTQFDLELEAAQLRILQRDLELRPKIQSKLRRKAKALARPLAVREWTPEMQHAEIEAAYA